MTDINFYKTFEQSIQNETDTQVPTLTTVSISANGPTSGFAGVSKVITLLFTSSETLTTAVPTVTIASRAAVVTNVGGNDYQAVITVTGTDTEGTTTFSINFSDRGGNTASSSAVTDSTSVVIGKGCFAFILDCVFYCVLGRIDPETHS